MVEEVKKYSALLRDAPNVSVPDNVLRTTRLVIERGVDDECATVVARCLKSFCAARGISAGTIDNALYTDLHTWFADPTLVKLKEFIRA